MQKFTDFPLDKKILSSIEQMGFTEPTEIQSKTFDIIHSGKDLLGIAQTGGGKTGAFVLPILQKLISSNLPAQVGFPRAIIMLPTRELAEQISSAIHSFSKGLGISFTTIYGGVQFAGQFRALKKPQDIIVATPGRLLDHIRRGNINPEMTEMFVLDEVDRMLDMGFLEDVKDLTALMPAEKQTVLFSATASPKIRSLVKTLLKDFETVEIKTQQGVAQNITHSLVYVPMKRKDALLVETINKFDNGQAVVFTRTKMQADKVSKWLNDNDISSDVIHGDKKQNVRNRIIANFRKNKLRVLVATDVAARGIDVDNVVLVVNYNMPLEAENYVHRVGRTGRAGRSGDAVSFCDNGDVGLLKDVEKFIGNKIIVDESSVHCIPESEVAPIENSRGRGGRSRNRSRQKNTKFVQKRPSGNRKPFGGGKKTGGGKKSGGGEGKSAGTGGKFNKSKNVVKAKKDGKVNKKKSKSFTKKSSAGKSAKSAQKPKKNMGRGSGFLKRK
ncbi:MAG: DEAD/DEAH box helicase [Alphaproteobacteria bacterium]